MARLPEKVRRRAGRFALFLRNGAARAKAWRRLRARLFYSLPGNAPRDPLRQVTTLRDFCIPVAAYPSTGEGAKISWRVSVQPARVLPRRPPQIAGESPQAAEGGRPLAAQLIESAGGLELALPDVFLASVASGRVLDGHFVAGAPGKIFADSIWARWVLDDVGTLDRIGSPPVQQHSGAYTLLGLYWWSYYYHWVLEILPRLAIIEQFPALADVPLLVPSGLNAWHLESLALSGIGQERLVEYDGSTAWHMERLYVPSLLAPTLCPSPWAVQWLRHRIGGVREPASHPAKRRLYISRQDAATRRVGNEDALLERLVEWGFERVCCGDISFAEQVRIFSEAEIVVGPHGAGLTNTVFAPPGAVLIELFPEDFVHGCYWGLAGVCGHEYCAVGGRGKSAEFNVDVDVVATTVRKMLTQGK